MGEKGYPLVLECNEFGMKGFPHRKIPINWKFYVKVIWACRNKIIDIVVHLLYICLSKYLHSNKCNSAGIYRAYAICLALCRKWG